jgi:hypothetical protein
LCWYEFHLQAGPSTPYPDDAATEIVAVLTGFVKVHQALLNTVGGRISYIVSLANTLVQLIGKHGLITLVPFFGPPVAAALVALEKVVDVSTSGAWSWS